MEKPVIKIIGQTRMLPDTLIIIGSGALLLFVLNAIIKIKPVEVKSGDTFS